MIITSDNTATDLATAKVGGVARVNAWLKQAGYADGQKLTQTTGELFAKYNALKPAEVGDITLDPTTKKALVIVNEDQQSLAIGRKGQNVRLASKLTGWDIDIMTRAELERSVADDNRGEAGPAAAAVAPGKTGAEGAASAASSEAKSTGAEPSATVVVKGNCGIPEYRGAEIYYSGTPPLMAEYARLARDAGARIIGGCCGTSCEHLAAMRVALDAHEKRERPTLETIIEKIGPLRNKTADESAAAPARERGSRRRS